jgi:hypothetical protein
MENNGMNIVTVSITILVIGLLFLCIGMCCKYAVPADDNQAVNTSGARASQRTEARQRLLAPQDRSVTNEAAVTVGGGASGARGFCSYCGKPRAQSGAYFCAFCGASLD